MALNAYLLMSRGRTFDPYPYILLNLFLSMLAAIQAPIILMSQNRQSDKDRISAEHDYEVNLKAELEIMLLHEKIDLLARKAVGRVAADPEGATESARGRVENGPMRGYETGAGLELNSFIGKCKLGFDPGADVLWRSNSESRMVHFSHTSKTSESSRC